MTIIERAEHIREICSNGASSSDVCQELSELANELIEEIPQFYQQNETWQRIGKGESGSFDRTIEVSLTELKQQLRAKWLGKE